MPHPYKSQLLLNLTRFYNQAEWRTLTWFEKGRDEMLFVLPFHQNVKEVYQSLLATLAELPDLSQAPERCVISFCYPDGSDYCSRLINPVAQDEINLALIGYTPGRRITMKDLHAEQQTASTRVTKSEAFEEPGIEKIFFGQLKAF